MTADLQTDAPARHAGLDGTGSDQSPVPMSIGAAEAGARAGEASRAGASGTDATRPVFSCDLHPDCDVARLVAGCALSLDAAVMVRRRLGPLLHQMAEEFALLLDLVEPCADTIPVGQLLAPVEEFEKLCRYARRFIAPHCNVDGIPPVVLGPRGVSALFDSDARDSSRRCG